MEKNKKITVLVLLLLVGCAAALLGYTYSKYTGEASASDKAKFAAWTIKVNGSNVSTKKFTLSDLNWTHVSNVQSGESEIIEPGASATGTIKIDATDAEVDAKYTVTVDKSNIPTAIKDNFTITLDEKESATGTVSFGSSKTINLKITWNENDAKDTEVGLNPTEITIPVTVTVEQGKNS